jgi:hypothetical protein
MTLGIDKVGEGEGRGKISILAILFEKSSLVLWFFHTALTLEQPPQPHN